MLIRVGHSPDPDDAFMFYALAKDAIPTGDFEFTHQLQDIETLNQRAFKAELELTAVSIHAYAYLADKYYLCNCGSSMGDGYGPMVITTQAKPTLDSLRGKTIAVPGKLTTAFLTLSIALGGEFNPVVMPFDTILDVAQAGEYCDPETGNVQKIDAGLIIHEGQLTYAKQGLNLAVDLGKWWGETTGSPLPLGANAIRKDLSLEVCEQVHKLLFESIQFGLEHRKEALAYALEWGRGLDEKMADEFVGMYVNEWTLDYGERGRKAVAELLQRGFEAGVIENLVVPEFIGAD